MTFDVVDVAVIVPQSARVRASVGSTWSPRAPLSHARLNLRDFFAAVMMTLRRACCWPHEWNFFAYKKDDGRINSLNFLSLSLTHHRDFDWFPLIKPKFINVWISWPSLSIVNFNSCDSIPRRRVWVLAFLLLSCGIFYDSQECSSFLLISPIHAIQRDILDFESGLVEVDKSSLIPPTMRTVVRRRRPLSSLSWSSTGDKNGEWSE